VATALGGFKTSGKRLVERKGSEVQAPQASSIQAKEGEGGGLGNPCGCFATGGRR